MKSAEESHPVQPFRIHAYPAVTVVLLIGLGIALANHVWILPAIWLGLSAACVVISLWRSGWIANAVMALAILGVGLSAAQIERFGFSPIHLANYTTDESRLAEVELHIDEPPRILAPPARDLRLLPPKQTVLASAVRVRTWDGWKPAEGKVMLTLAQPNPLLAEGQTIRAMGLIERPLPPTNPGEFDFADYCRDQRILLTMRVEHADGVTILDDPGPGAVAWLQIKARHLLAMGFPAERSLDQAFAEALVLGDSDPQLSDLENQFVRVGVIYQITISGLHIAIVGGTVLLICRLLRRPPRFSLIVALLAVALYAMVALPSWPGWRAVIMCAVGSAGILARRQPRGLQMLAVAATAVLLIHPSDLFAPGFQIGIAAVLGLILCAGRLNRMFWKWQRGPDAAVKPYPSRLWIRAVSLIVAAIVAWICTMPLVAYHYQRISSFSVPASLMMLPLTILTLLGGLLKILLTLAWPSGSGLWASMVVIPIEWMRRGIADISTIPFASVRIGTPSLWMVIGFYALLALSLMQASTRWLRWLRRVGSAGALAALVLWPAACRPAAAAPQTASMQITLLDVGDGQCAVIQTAGNHAILIDAGSYSISDLADRVLEPSLLSSAAGNIDRIFLSDGGFDHISAAPEAFSDFNHPEILTSTEFDRWSTGNYPAGALLDAIHDAGKSPTLIHRGEHLDLGDGATMDVLWPPQDCDLNSNNCGLVLKLRFGGKSVLFTGDIQEPAELALMEHAKDLKSDILIAPHSGAADAITPEFLRAVSPSVILASSARELTQKQKEFDELAHKIPLYRTSQCGAITVSIDTVGKIQIKTYASNETASAVAER
ncbi:MAG: DNA internalization-related competence protein ComEC/Rec2 [Tepidisphaeraceae bacterium]|jgi:competence protein ComEC